MRSLLALIAIAVSANVLHAQTDNLGRLQQDALEVADSLVAFYPPGDTICVRVEPHPAAWLVEQALLASTEKRAIGVRQWAEATQSGISVAITSISVEYLAVDEPDSVVRMTHLALSATLDSLSHQGGRTRLTRSFSVVSFDTVAARETSSLENSGYDFTHGSAPPRSSGGFWSRVIEPAVILGASVVMVILLFTVRSQ